MFTISRALHADSAARGLFELNKLLGVPTSLRELGVKHEDLDRVADAALKTPYPNPRKLERSSIRDLLQNAWSGQAPA